MSTLKAGKLQHPDAANSSIEFDASGNITKFVGPSGGADGNVLTKSGTAPAWTSAGAVGGLVHVHTETFSAVSSVSVNSKFTSTYQNYRIMLNCVTSAAGAIRMRLRASGSDDTSSSYGSYARGRDNNSNNIDLNENTTSWLLPYGNNAGSSGYTFDLNSPQSSLLTTFNGTTGSISSGGNYYAGFFMTGVFFSTTQFDGMTIYPASGTFTGNLRIYGYNNG